MAPNPPATVEDRTAPAQQAQATPLTIPRARLRRSSKATVIQPYGGIPEAATARAKSTASAPTPAARAVPARGGKKTPKKVAAKSRARKTPAKSASARAETFVANK